MKKHKTMEESSCFLTKNFRKGEGLDIRQDSLREGVTPLWLVNWLPEIIVGLGLRTTSIQEENL